jgi:hypothetical protein
LENDQRDQSQYVQAGVELLCGLSVERIESSGCGQRVLIAGDLRIDADVGVTGLGSLPNVEWLASSGLEISNGILCDEQAGREVWVYSRPEMSRLGAIRSTDSTCDTSTGRQRGSRPASSHNPSVAVS